MGRMYSMTYFFTKNTYLTFSKREKPNNGYLNLKSKQISSGPQWINIFKLLAGSRFVFKRTMVDRFSKINMNRNKKDLLYNLHGDDDQFHANCLSIKSNS